MNADPGQAYVEVTLVVTEDFMPQAKPAILSVAQMAADIGTLAGIDRDNATDAEQAAITEIDRRMNPPVVDEHGVRETARRDAEWLAKNLGLNPVATASRTTFDEPVPSMARGYAWGGQNPYNRVGFAQGCVLASWEPVTYPANGDWSFGPDIYDYFRFLDADIVPRPHPVAVTISDPLADLQLWVGATTEYRLLRDRTRWQDGTGYDPRMLPYAIEWLQARRNQQSGGKPLWETDLRPEPLRKGEWTMFVCRATDRHLIPSENLTELQAALAVSAEVRQSGA